MTRRERTRTRIRPLAGTRHAWPAVVAAFAVALAGQFMIAAAEVTVHDPGKAFAGYNLRVTHSPAGAVLMDMDGSTLHTWTCLFDDVFPGQDVPDVPGFSRYWTTARLLPDGGVLGVFGGVGLVKLDRSSRVVWVHAGGEHDDLVVAEDGRIYALGAESRRANWVNQKEPVLDDYVLVLSEDGEVVSRVSLLSAVASSDFSNIIKSARMDRSGHVLRANSLHVLDGGLSDRIPSFEEGNVLVSLGGLDTVAVVDMKSGSLAWTLFGMWLGQLDSALLLDGDLLVFEHRDGDPAVVEFDPVTMGVKWSYERNSPNDLDDRWGGTAQRLPNGNTLISESGRGRAFEVTPQGEVVWEYVNSVAGGAIAKPFELTRIGPEFPMDWLGN